MNLGAPLDSFDLLYRLYPATAAAGIVLLIVRLRRRLAWSDPIDL